MSPFLLFDAAGPMAPSGSTSPDRGLSIKGSPERASETGPCVGDAPSEYVIPTPAD